MFSALQTAFAETWRNLRANFFQTFLSVLGIIIGVGALVTMLALIDGLEKVARDGIADNSSLESVMVRPRLFNRVDNVSVRLENPIELTAAVADSLRLAMEYPSAIQLVASQSTFINHPDTADKIGIQYVAISLPIAEDEPELAHGRFLNEQDQTGQRAVTTINHKLAERLTGSTNDVSAAVGKQLLIEDQTYEVVGITKAQEIEPTMQAILPYAVVSQGTEDAPGNTSMLVNFDQIEDVRPGEEFISEWFAARYPEVEEPVETMASLKIVEQMELGFSVFRLVMGFLIGIAVVVGGVGVMNVMLMSINERTVEIGIRKAVGANRRRIVAQFLSESVAISAIGSFFGLLLGVGLALLAAAVIGLILEIDFSAVFSLQTLVVVSLVAVVTGVVFGTYPARRAAGLDPVRAIQRN
jgi:ABC-type antimicrobial peptide transport system permease subunit